MANTCKLSDNLCAFCARPDCTLKCGRCELDRYCSIVCQKAHWKDHRKVCISPLNRKPRDIKSEHKPVLDDVCNICLEPIKKSTNNSTKLFCNHIFHTECIYKWMDIKSYCPLCNRLYDGYDRLYLEAIKAMHANDRNTILDIIKRFKTLYNKTKPSLEILTILADLYHFLGKIALSILHYEKAITLFPDNYVSYCNLAILYSKQKNITLAQQYFEKALILTNSEKPIIKKPVLFNYGKCLIIYCKSLTADTGDIDTTRETVDRLTQYAIELTQKAIDLCPTDYKLYIFMGDIYFELPDLEKALYNFNKVIEYNPLSVETLYKIGKILLGLERLEESLEYFTRTNKLMEQLKE